MNNELFSPGIIGNFIKSRTRRAFFWSMLTWLPPVLAVIIGKFSEVQAPEIGLFQDFAFHVRCLLAVPLLVLVEKYIFRSANAAIPHSLKLEVIQSDKAIKIEKCRKKIYTLQRSLWSEAIMLFISLTIVYSHSYIDLSADISTWRNDPALPYVLAQMWNKWIGLTIYYYFFLRWLFKFILWCAFLIRFTFLKPRLQSLHPDQMGGLYFLSKTQVLFGGFATAFSAVAAANISTSIIYEKIPVEKFYLPLVIYGALAAIFYVAPLAVFTPHLLEAKRKGKSEYGALSSKYSAFFRKKWFEEAKVLPETLLGSPDLQSLNDLMESFSVLKSMRVFALNHRLFMILLVFIGAPLLPLILFKIPLKEVMPMLLKHIL